jgi:myosin protein heavy chain
MRHKHTQEQTSINEQLENIKKVKLALDKQKQTLEAENADLATELRNVNQSRQENDRRRKQAEQQFNEVQVRKIIIKII